MAGETEFRTVVSDRAVNGGDGKRACLIMIRGDYIGQIYELVKSDFFIGRADACDLTLSDTCISRKHACIERREDGYYIEDLASTNGCWVNAERITAPTRLYEGDKIRMDQILFKFSFQDDEDAEYHLMMRNMAVKDDLTKIYNKRYFKDALLNEFAFAKRNATSLALVLFDIDQFKQVNDNLGHPAGDNVLKQLASVIDNDVRGYDIFARVGGEEFAFLIKGLPIEKSLVLAQRVRKIIENHVFEYDGEHIRITISLGVAGFDRGSALEKPDDLLKAADDSLYEAKHTGRNKVCYRQD